MDLRKSTASIKAPGAAASSCNRKQSVSKCLETHKQRQLAGALTDTTSVWPCMAAMMSGVRPNEPTKDVSAPQLSAIRTASRLPLAAPRTSISVYVSASSFAMIRLLASRSRAARAAASCAADADRGESASRANLRSLFSSRELCSCHLLPDLWFFRAFLLPNAASAVASAASSCAPNRTTIFRVSAPDRTASATECGLQAEQNR